jgi:glutathione S-transferase
MRLHDYPTSANCYKVRLLLAQLGRDYERVPVDIFDGDTLTDEYARLNPARQTPVLEIDGEEPLPESNAILVRLAEGTEYMPEDPGERAQVVRWLIFEQTDVIPGIAGLRFRLITKRLDPESGSAQRRHDVGAACLRLIDDHLSGRGFVVGERYTIADIALYAYVHVADEAGLDLSDYPALGEWIARVEGTPGYMNDLEPYPPNAELGAGSSIYG